MSFSWELVPLIILNINLVQLDRREVLRGSLSKGLLKMILYDAEFGEAHVMQEKRDYWKWMWTPILDDDVKEAHRQAVIDKFKRMFHEIHPDVDFYAYFEERPDGMLFYPKPYFR